MNMASSRVVGGGAATCEDATTTHTGGEKNVQFDLIFV